MHLHALLPGDYFLTARGATRSAQQATSPTPNNENTASFCLCDLSLLEPEFGRRHERQSDLFGMNRKGARALEATLWKRDVFSSLLQWSESAWEVEARGNEPTRGASKFVVCAAGFGPISLSDAVMVRTLSTPERRSFVACTVFRSTARSARSNPGHRARVDSDGPLITCRFRSRLRKTSAATAPISTRSIERRICPSVRRRLTSHRLCWQRLPDRPPEPSDRYDCCSGGDSSRVGHRPALCRNSAARGLHEVQHAVVTAISEPDVRSRVAASAVATDDADDIAVPQFRFDRRYTAFWDVIERTGRHSPLHLPERAEQLRIVPEITIMSPADRHLARNVRHAASAELASDVVD